MSAGDILMWAWLAFIGLGTVVAVIRHWRESDDLHRQGYEPVKWTGVTWIWRRRGR